jgi:hypothetical protein
MKSMKSGGGKPFAAPLAAFQADACRSIHPESLRFSHSRDLPPGSHRSGQILAQVPQPMQRSGSGITKFDSVNFFHFQRTGTDDLFAHPDTEAAAHAAVRWRSQINAVRLGHFKS